MDKEFVDIYAKCKPYTQTEIERMYALYKATKYIIKNRIPGDFVECGVWKGGSAMIIAYTLTEMNETQRKIYLYDTYEGMTEPMDKDIQDYDGTTAQEMWLDFQEKNIHWNYVPLEEVTKNLFSTGYPQKNVIFVKGKVEDTIPSTIPNAISLLRLDTDWYESTYHELYYLFPELSVNGVVIIDDYGHFRGAREATDKYFEENNTKILLNRIDYTGRIGIKVK